MKNTIVLSFTDRAKAEGEADFLKLSGLQVFLFGPVDMLTIGKGDEERAHYGSATTLWWTVVASDDQPQIVG